jgi:hypothetical protein
LEGFRDVDGCEWSCTLTNECSFELQMKEMQNKPSGMANTSSFVQNCGCFWFNVRWAGWLLIDMLMFYIHTFGLQNLLHGLSIKVFMRRPNFT